MLMLQKQTIAESRFKEGACKSIGSQQITWTWWNVNEDPAKLRDAKIYLAKVKNNENLFEALHIAGKACDLFSAAKP